MANTLLYHNYWSDRLASRFGFGVSSTPDEYELYNRERRELYARQDHAFKLQMRAIGITLAILLLAICVML